MYFLYRILTPQLYFNSSLWYQQRDIIVMATDDDIIRDSPYGAVVSIGTMSERPKYNDKSINLSLVIQDTDDGEWVYQLLASYTFIATLVCSGSMVVQNCVLLPFMYIN